MDNLSELAFGKDYVERENRFDMGVEEIDKKYESFFKDRESRIFKGEKDKLVNHITTSYDGNKIRIGFSDELSESIKDDVMNLFYKVWKTD